MWFERAMAILATANLGLILFDLTYVPWRNFWLQGTIPIPLTDQKIQVPMPQVTCPDTSVKAGDSPATVTKSAITCLYDPVKDIEPHRDTQGYLNKVKALEPQLQPGGVQSPEVKALLADLGNRSEEMIQTDPFKIANKSGTLEKIKDRIRLHIYGKGGRDKSSRKAFQTFWNQRVPADPSKELAWFNREIAPLMETNYFRSIDESGQPTNYFWRLDAPFVALFGLEFLARTYYLSRRYKSLSWLDAMLWRWYDVPLFFPFGILLPSWAWLRAFSVAIRLHQSQLVDMERVREQATQGVLAGIAEELTEVVIIQVIGRAQSSIRRGEITRWLAQNPNERKYVDVNQKDEIEEIATHILKLTVYQVIPKVQPDIQALLSHALTTALNQSPVYQNLQTLPGMGDLSNQVTERISQEVTAALYSAMVIALEDKVGAKLTSQLVRNFTEAMVTEVRQERSLEELQSLVTDLLEEIKINYVQRLSTEDMESILEETRQSAKLVAKRPSSA